MNTLSPKLVLVIVLSAGILISSTTRADTLLPWEIPDPDLPYIAMVRADPMFGAAVIYNPTLCERVGDACAFFRSHEYAHAFLNDLMLQPQGYPKFLENRADCWAAKTVEPHEVYAAYQFFINIEDYLDIPVFGDPAQRAENISKCAREKGNWPASAVNLEE